jgi:hypothetical protein
VRSGTARVGAGRATAPASGRCTPFTGCAGLPSGRRPKLVAVTCLFLGTTSGWLLIAVELGVERLLSLKLIALTDDTRRSRSDLVVFLKIRKAETDGRPVKAVGAAMEDRLGLRPRGASSVTLGGGEKMFGNLAVSHR